MGKVNTGALGCQFCQPCKFRSIISGNTLENSRCLNSKVVHNALNCLLNRVSRVISCLDPDGITSFSFCHRYGAGLILIFAAQDGIHFPVTKFLPLFHAFRAQFNAVAKNPLVFSHFFLLCVAF